MSAFVKKDIHDEIRGLLSTNLQYITPTTVWFLAHDNFAMQKQQQMVRLKASFTVHDKFDDKFDQLINFAALIKSPPELADIWMKAVIRTRAPLSYKQVKESYKEVLRQITGAAELAQVNGQHLMEWARILFGNNPIESGLTTQECWDKLVEENPELVSMLPEEMPETSDSYFRQTAPRALPN